MSLKFDIDTIISKIATEIYTISADVSTARLIKREIEITTKQMTTTITTKPHTREEIREKIKNFIKTFPEVSTVEWDNEEVSIYLQSKAPHSISEFQKGTPMYEWLQGLNEWLGNTPEKFSINRGELF